MRFTRLTIHDLETIRPYFTDHPSRYCDATLGTTMMWRDFASTQFLIAEGALFLKANYVGDGATSYAPPLLTAYSDKAFEKALLFIVNTVKSRSDSGGALTFAPVAEREAGIIKRVFPSARVTPERDWFDYLYEAEDLKTFAGRRFQGQRNHVNRFFDDYPGWIFQKITAAEIPACLEYLIEFEKQNPRENYPLYVEGNAKTLEMLENWDKYGQVGGCLTVPAASGGKPYIVGVTVGEISGDTLYIHSEKASREARGAYPMLVREFASAFAQGSVKYINREEDDGVEGLRTSKLSYQPVSLVEKYQIEINLR